MHRLALTQLLALADASTAEFRTNAGLATRVALGVLLAGVAQTRASASQTPSGYHRQWLFLPDHYFLGGLTYAAVMVVFAGARTVGGVLEQMWQIDVGVALALLFDFVVFASIPMTQANLVNAPANLLRGGATYSISLRDLAVVLPLLLLFTFVVLVSPMVRACSHTSAHALSMLTRLSCVLNAALLRADGELPAKQRQEVRSQHESLLQCVWRSISASLLSSCTLMPAWCHRQR